MDKELSSGPGWHDDHDDHHKQEDQDDDKDDGHHCDGRKGSCRRQGPERPTHKKRPAERWAFRLEGKLIQPEGAEKDNRRPKHDKNKCRPGHDKDDCRLGHGDAPDRSPWKGSGGSRPPLHRPGKSD